MFLILKNWLIMHLLKPLLLLWAAFQEESPVDTGHYAQSWGSRFDKIKSFIMKPPMPQSSSSVLDLIGHQLSLFWNGLSEKLADPSQPP